MCGSSIKMAKEEGLDNTLGVPIILMPCGSCPKFSLKKHATFLKPCR